MNKCPTNYPSFHSLFHFLSMVSGGLEPLCHRNSSTFESNNKSETKWKTAAPNERRHDIGCVKCWSSPCFTFWNFSFLRTKLNVWGSKPTMTWDISADPGSATWRLRAKNKLCLPTNQQQLKLINFLMCHRVIRRFNKRHQITPGVHDRQ